VNDVIQKAIVH